MELLPDSSLWVALGDFIKVALGEHQSLQFTIVALVQLVMIFFRTRFAERAGVWRLSIVLGLTVVGQVAAGIAEKKTLLQILSDGVVLSSVQVFLHQLFKQMQDQKLAKAGVQAPIVEVKK